MHPSYGQDVLIISMVAWWGSFGLMLLFSESWPLTEFQIGARMFAGFLIGAATYYQVTVLVRRVLENERKQ
ncbi:hypothetical protein J7444_08335 [Labrenzia sp. R4_1]|uniref:hypothetical protein n=1 Tax=Labrenzia sp. R4_1 TaxID=2821106 RepID=UPI001ADBEBC0|nr:hypothetical protein [Labrenzia sp. R4_1]MBO9424726.1 hypothetical protein [Labrenzia sp. R4_1]